MRVTVLGAGAACPYPGERSAGYLLEDQGQRILLDCGPGVASLLLHDHRARPVDHIIISHMHGDHFLDLLALRFCVSRELAGVADPPVRLHLPPGGEATVEAICEALSLTRNFCKTAFATAEYDPARPLELGPLTASFAPTRHYIPCWAVRVAGSSSVVYSGDTAPSAAVTDLARGSDLFICEGTLREPENGDVRGHSTPAEAAQMAREADVQQLLLSHFWFDADLERARREAAHVFEGALAIGRSGLQIEVGSGPAST